MKLNRKPEAGTKLAEVDTAFDGAVVVNVAEEPPQRGVAGRRLIVRLRDRQLPQTIGQRPEIDPGVVDVGEGDRDARHQPAGGRDDHAVAQIDHGFDGAGGGRPRQRDCSHDLKERSRHGT